MRTVRSRASSGNRRVSARSYSSRRLRRFSLGYAGTHRSRHACRARVRAAPGPHSPAEPTHVSTTFVTLPTPHREHAATRSHDGTGRVVARLLGLLLVVLLTASAGPDSAWAVPATDAAMAMDTVPPAVIEAADEAQASTVAPCSRGDCDDAGSDCSPVCAASCSAACGVPVVAPDTALSVSPSDAFTPPSAVSLAVPPVTRRLRPPIA